MIRVLVLALITAAAFMWIVFPPCAGMLCAFDPSNAAAFSGALDKWQATQGIVSLSLVLSLLAVVLVRYFHYRNILIFRPTVKSAGAAGQLEIMPFAADTLRRAFSEGKIKIQ